MHFVAALGIYSVDLVDMLRRLIGPERPSRRRDRTPAFP
jgi:hypothetical protein